MRRAVRLLLAAVLAGGILFLFAIPAQTWLSQRSAMSTANRRLSELTSDNKALARQVAQLQSPSYVEQLARSQFGLVMPGQPAYEILPAASSSGSSG